MKATKDQGQLCYGPIRQCNDIHVVDNICIHVGWYYMHSRDLIRSVYPIMQFNSYIFNLPRWIIRRRSMLKQLKFYGIDNRTITWAELTWCSFVRQSENSGHASMVEFDPGLSLKKLFKKNLLSNFSICTLHERFGVWIKYH